MKHCKPYCFYCYLVWYLLSHCIYSLGYNASKHWRRSDVVPPPISLYLERDGGHSWFSCLKLLNTDHLPGVDLPHNCLPNSLLSEQQLDSPFCSGSFWKRVVCSFFYGIWNVFLLITEALLHKHCVLLQTSVIDICDGHDHFLIHDVYSVQGQVITVLEKWITHAGQKRHQQELQHPSWMWPVNYETCHGEKLK